MPKQETVIRDADPRVTLSFAPMLGLESDLVLGLDLSIPDDRIVAEALAYRAAFPDKDVRVLSHDTHLMVTASQLGMDYLEIPDNWLLPPEPDARDRQLARVLSELDELRNLHPSLSVIALDQNDRELKSLAITIENFAELQSTQIEDLVQRVKSAHPMATEFPSSEFGWATLKRGPTQNEIDEYQQEGYPQWVARLTRFFRELPRRLGNPSRRKRLCFVLSNTGRVPGESVIVKIEALGELFLELSPGESDEWAADALPAYPSPPDPPRMQELIPNRTPRVDHYNQLPPLPDLVGRRTDRHAFYWRGGQPRRPARVWELECEEFRHHSDPERFEAVVQVPPGCRGSSQAVRCVVSASNLPHQVSLTVPVEINTSNQDTVELARQIAEKRS